MGKNKQPKTNTQTCVLILIKNKTKTKGKAYKWKERKKRRGENKRENEREKKKAESSAQELGKKSNDGDFSALNFLYGSENSLGYYWIQVDFQIQGIPCTTYCLNDITSSSLMLVRNIFFNSLYDTVS